MHVAAYIGELQYFKIWNRRISVFVNGQKTNFVRPGHI